MSDPNDSTSTGEGVPLTFMFLEFCAKVRTNDPSLLPELGEPLRILNLGERESIELSDALLGNTSVTYLELDTAEYTKSTAKAMAKYVRTSKSSQHIRWPRNDESRGEQTYVAKKESAEKDEEMLCYFLPAIQESTALKELYMELPPVVWPSKLAFTLTNMLTHTQSLRSLSLVFPDEGIVVAAAMSALKRNTTLRELTLEFAGGITNISSLLTSLSKHSHLRRLCLRGYEMDLSGLATLLLSDSSKITELDIQRLDVGYLRRMGLATLLQSLGRHRTLIKLGLHNCLLDHGQARLLQMALCNMPSLHSVALSNFTLSGRSAELAQLALALYDNASIQVLAISKNAFLGLQSANIIRDILRRNKTITTLDLSNNRFGLTPDSVECIANGLGSNSTLLKIDLSGCSLYNDNIPYLAQTLGSQNTTLQKLILARNSITSRGVGVLLEAFEHSNNHPITDLDLGSNSIENEGARFIARSLRNNALPNLTRLSLYSCEIKDDGLMALVSALEHNTSLLQLDLRDNLDLSKTAFLALATSLPKLKVLQRLDLSWCHDLASAMPLLLEGLRSNTSLFRFHVAGCAPSSVPPTTAETNRCAGGWMREMERLGYRNRFRTLIRAPEERRPPRGIWVQALTQVAPLPDVIFEVLRSKPNLVPSENTESSREEAAIDTSIPKKRKHGDSEL
jgi:Ran GTPase-activating protein (RanGAP) involved in mRNA processing and transport